MKRLPLLLFALLLAAPVLAEVDPFPMKTGDRLPFYPVKFRTSTGVVDLSGSTVTATMVDSTGNTVFADAVVYVTATTRGEAEYRWATGDTAAAGTYYIEFRVVDPTGRPYTLPSSFRAAVVITDSY